MKTENEIQNAHDVLIAVALGEVKIPMIQKDKELLQASLDVLCWVLGHNHNKTFVENLDNILKEIENAGYKMYKK